MNRRDLQTLADIRIEEAAILLSQGKYDGAYYLGGYAVECGLKACIAKLTNEHDFPDKKLANACYTHNIENLVRLAELDEQRKNDSKADPDFSANWSVVKDWEENSRYERKAESLARDLYGAVTNATHGVLPWIKQHW